MQPAEARISSAFIWRRVHSLMGLWLVLYLAEHLLVNSQAALWLGEWGHVFIQMVNSLESIPYLPVVETVLIGVPLVIHGVWGIHRALTAKLNSSKSDGTAPSLPYGRNRAFTWQRLTSWILLFGILGHVIQMRFLEQPKKVNEQWVVQVSADERLPPLAEKLGVQLVSEGRVVHATANSPGAAMLLVVRDTFKSPLMIVLYTIFLLAAAFHAFNGFWTFLITWGIILSARSQRAMIPLSIVGMGLLTFLGLAAIWGSYWLVK
ncbi:MAG: succinate dehydrogenase [Verrucomicrobiota bacterium]|nr:succinate dehydrogenase [Verrucomicrobiota bacterium]